MRDGFLVTSQRKKLWNVQINLINEFARVCKKHNLRWFAYGGTLLGAARHKGFIPWDDDVDVMMFRPDYEKFKLVAANEIKAPYFVDNWYNYRLESEGASLSDVEGDFQFIPKTQEMLFENRWFTNWPSIRLRDSRTLMLEMPTRNFIDQGIFIDIFPFDPVPPLSQQNQAVNFFIAGVLLLATAVPQRIKQALQNNTQFPIDTNELKKFLALPYRERGRILENFLKEKFFMSARVGEIRDYTLTNGQRSYESANFADVTYLPFEKIEVPAPINYDLALTEQYGDWRKPVFTHTHAQLYSTEISWREYFQKTAIR